MTSLSLQVEAAVLYPGMRPTVLRIRLRYYNCCLYFCCLTFCISTKKNIIVLEPLYK